MDETRSEIACKLTYFSYLLACIFSGMMGENNNGTDSKKEIKSGSSLDPSKTLASVEGKTISMMGTDENAFKNPQSYQKLNVANDIRGN